MREGSLEAPKRHPLNWRDADFTDETKLFAEMERVFDLCHGCRRCFNLCDSFPRLFDLVDESPTGEVDGVAKADYWKVVDACTLCDMCFMTKCPYVPPHAWDLDFPHLMVRARAVKFKQGKFDKKQGQLSEMDRNGPLGVGFSGIANWASKRGNALTRPVMETVNGIHRDAHLPEFARQSCRKRAKAEPVTVNPHAPAVGRKAVIYASCFGEYNDPDIVLDTRKVLAINGIAAEIVYPECCGMPQLEQGDIARVAEKARRVAAALKPYVDGGHDIVVPVASCALMLKFEWPLIESGDENVKNLSRATFDVTEYVVDIAAKEGLADGLKPLGGGVVAHIACHARAQNMGRKAEELLKLIPGTETKVIERCSGHGGSWGIMKAWFETGMKVGAPVARDAAKAAPAYVVSECPLACDHIKQGMERKDFTVSGPGETLRHPVQLLARAYGL
ncbi:MAG: glycerol-3-phosphate dehydrogenase [Alphaproteobacteria bacterium]|nr:glycerol-3-phosphate dehydrogenase [Alphaproteobacteria bacterium]